MRYLARARRREAHRGSIAAADQPSKPSTEGRNLGRKWPSDSMSFVDPKPLDLRLILFRPACFPPLCEVPGSGKTARSPQGSGPLPPRPTRCPQIPLIYRTCLPTLSSSRAVNCVPYLPTPWFIPCGQFYVPYLPIYGVEARRRRASTRRSAAQPSLPAPAADFLGRFKCLLSISHVGFM